jgi:DeoR family fructose operon transcriptional repressor
MQSRQLLRRVHGGAVPVERMNHEPLVEARDMVNAEEKLRIATPRRRRSRSAAR